MQYCSFTKRVFAAIFDMALVSLIVMICAPLLVNMQELQPILDKSKAQVPITLIELTVVTEAFFIFAVVSTLIYVCMDVVMPATRYMASPGKLLLKMTVVDRHGQKLGMGKAMARHAAKFVSALTVIGLFMPLWNAQKQALHDAMSGTLVVKKKRKG